MTLYVIRHGQTKKNTTGLVHGKQDAASLDRVGLQQAERLARFANSESIEEVYCSPEKRALQTAGIICQEIGREPVRLDLLHERDWGRWSGQPWQVIKEKLEHMSLEERYRFSPPGGESWQHMEERLIRALSVIRSSSYDRVGVVSHGGAIRALMPIIKGEPKETSFQYDFANASVTTVDCTEGTFVVRAENDTKHL